MVKVEGIVCGLMVRTLRLLKKKCIVEALRWCNLNKDTTKKRIFKTVIIPTFLTQKFKEANAFKFTAIKCISQMCFYSAFKEN